MPSKKAKRKAARKEQAKLLKSKEEAKMVTETKVLSAAYKDGDHIEKISDTLVKVTNKSGVVHYKHVLGSNAQYATTAGKTGGIGTKTSTYTGNTWNYSTCSHWQDPIEIAGHKILVTGILGGKGKGVWPDFGIYLDYRWCDYLELDLVSFGSGVKGTKQHPVWVMHWKDYGDIPQRKFRRIIDEVGKQWEKGREVIEIGCLGAHGRTGTVLAGLLIKYENMGAEEAINAVRERHCKTAVESHCQKVMVYEYAGEAPPKAPAISTKTYSSGICGIAKCKKTYANCECTQEELFEAGEISDTSYINSAKKQDAYCMECKGFVISCPHKTAFSGPKVLGPTQAAHTNMLTWCSVCDKSVMTCEHKEKQGDYYCVKDGCHRFVVTCQHDKTVEIKGKFREADVQIIAQGEAIGIICDRCDKDISFCDCDPEQLDTKCLECDNGFMHCCCNLELDYTEWYEKNSFDAERAEVIVIPEDTIPACPECKMDVFHCNCEQGKEWWEQQCTGCGRKAYGCVCNKVDICPLCDQPVEDCGCATDLKEWCQYCGKFSFMCDCSTGVWKGV